MKRLIAALAVLLLMQMAEAQKVGIGIANPTRAILEVHGAVGGTSAIFGGETAGISLMRNWPSIGFNYYYDGNSRYIGNGFAASQAIDPTGGYMAFDFLGSGQANGVANNPRRVFGILNNGNCWIGSTPRNASLSVPRITGTQSTAWFYGSSHHSTFNYGPNEDTYIRAGKDGGTVLINDVPNGLILVPGMIGVNTGNPVYPLDITEKYFGQYARGLSLVDPNGFNNWLLSVPAGNPDFYLSSNNLGIGFISASDGHWNHYSDRRLKQDIQSLPGTLNRLKELRPVTYRMKSDSLNRQIIGLVAQELKNQFPELVVVEEGTNGGYKGISGLHTVNYSGLHLVVIRAIQEQQQMINEQEREIDALEKEYDQLLRQLQPGKK